MIINDENMKKSVHGLLSLIMIGFGCFILCQGEVLSEPACFGLFFILWAFRPFKIIW